MSQTTFVSLPPWMAPYVSEDLVRMGRKLDGGYVLNLRSIRDLHTLYSFGLGHDWSFEEDLQSFCNSQGFSLRIYAWDFRVGVTYFLMILIRGLVKFAIRIIDRSTLKNRLQEFYSYCLFWRIRRLNQHKRQFAKVETFAKLPMNKGSFGIKMDIEGAEWEILRSRPSLFKDANFIVLEIHNLQEHLEDFKHFLEWLGEFHWLSHLHMNNSGGVVGNMPRVPEVTFCSRRYSHGYEYVQSLPINGLDFPCAPALNDYSLNFTDK